MDEARRGVDVSRGIMITRTRSPPNSEAPTSALTAAITPSGRFFVRSHFPVPKVDAGKWSLEIAGEVRRQRTFSYQQLRKMRMVTVPVTLECAGNGRTGFQRHAEDELVWGPGAVGTTTWTGVPLRDLLKAVGIREGATEVVAEGLDRGRVHALPKAIAFSRGLPIKKAMAGETLVALKMNGRRITPEHGFPARLVVPGWYGMASVKWLHRIKVVSGAPFRAYFNGPKYTYYYAKDGREVEEPVTKLRVKSLIIAPAEGDALLSGVPTTVKGKAWSGSGRITAVEVNVGEGWTKAKLDPQRPGRFAWTSWSKRWVPQRTGKATISARAIDEDGATQPAEAFENRFQYGYNAIHTVSVDVRRRPARTAD